MRRGDVGDDDEDYDNEDFEEEEEEVDVEVEEDEKVAEEEDKRQGMRARALPVDGDPDFDSGPPVDGFEYLRRVRHEANTVPDVMVSPTIDPRAFDHKQTRGYVPELAGYKPPKCPDCARPDKRWQREFLSDFSDLRARVSRTAARREMSGRPAGGGQGLALASRAALERMNDGEEPEGVSFDLLIGCDELSAGAAFRAHARALASRLAEERDELALGTERSAPARMHARAAWFYALASRVGLPLDAETSASVRALARALATRRSKVTSSSDPSLPHIQVCLAVAGKYFGQFGSEEE